MRSKCSKCGKLKTTENTWGDIRFDDGLRSDCIDCYQTNYCDYSRELKCPICSKIFNAYGVGKRVYCSDECFALGNYTGKPYTWYKKALKLMGCTSCGYRRVFSGLEFHHVGLKLGKDFGRLQSIPEIEREINRNDVVVLCVNCHREVHAGVLDDKQFLDRKVEVLACG